MRILLMTVGWHLFLIAIQRGKSPFISVLEAAAAKHVRRVFTTTGSTTSPHLSNRCIGKSPFSSALFADAKFSARRAVITPIEA